MYSTLELKFLVLIMSIMLIVPVAIYRRRWGNLGTFSPFVGFLLLSLYVFLRVEDLIARILAMIAGIDCALISLYAVRYADVKYEGRMRDLLYTLNNIFGLLVIFFIISDTILEFAIYFTLAGLVGFFMVAFDSFAGKNPEAWSAALKYIIVSMIPSDVATLAFVGLALTQGKILEHPANVSLEMSPILLMVILVGFSAKAAVAPLHFWIADAHGNAPSPASAILSGLMVKMGIYGLYVTYKSTEAPIIIPTMLCVLAALTIIHGGLSALAQDDIKRLLAYSTMSHTSTMAMLLALGEVIGTIPTEAIAAYILAHSVFKATLFLDAGFAEAVYHSRSISYIKDHAHPSFMELSAIVLPVLSLIGIPPTPGFIYKLLTFTFIAKSLEHSYLAAFALIVLAIKIALGAGYGLRYLAPRVASAKSITGFKPAKYFDLLECILVLSLFNILGTLLLIPIIIH